MREDINKLNELLELAYRDIQKVEHSMQRSVHSPLTISELHFIEAVGLRKNHPCTVSALAAELGITMASVTVAVNKLVTRGMLTKEKSPDDGRSVQIRLTREGQRMYRMHRYFHRQMVRELTQELTPEELKALLHGIEKLDAFFRKAVGEPADSEKEGQP